MAVRIICYRERIDESTRFVPEEYWTITALLKKGTQEFEAKFYGRSGEKLELKNKEQTDEILKALDGREYVVTSIKKGIKKKSAPPPFTTSYLQQAAASALGFTAKRTMLVAQQLYEGVELGESGPVGLVTYIRTDSTRVSDEALAAVAQGLRGVLEQAGPNAVAVLGSARLTNEAAYLLSRFARAAVGTNNVDSRMGTVIPALAEATPTDLRQADVILLFQGDPSQEAPVVELWVREALRHGARLYVVHPLKLALGRLAAMELQPKPGTAHLLIAGLLAKFGQAPAGDYGLAKVASLTG